MEVLDKKDEELYMKALTEQYEAEKQDIIYDQSVEEDMYNVEHMYDTDKQKVYQRKDKKHILDYAKELIEGEKKSDYGSVNRSFTRIAEYWNTHILHKYAENKDIKPILLSPFDVAVFMILFKIAREENKHKRDNLVDIIGYTALADKLVEKGE